MSLSEEQVLELRQAEQLADWGPHEQRLVIHLGLGQDESLEDHLKCFSAHTTETFGKTGERNVCAEITPGADAETAAALLDHLAEFLESPFGEELVRGVLDSSNAPQDGDGDADESDSSILDGCDSRPPRSPGLPEGMARAKEEYCRLAQESIENFQKQSRTVITATDTKDHGCFGSADEDGFFLAAVPFDQYHWPHPPLLDLHFYSGADPKYVALCCRKMAKLLRSDRGQDVLNMKFIEGGGSRQPWANVSHTGEVEIHAPPVAASQCPGDGTDADRIAAQLKDLIQRAVDDISDPEVGKDPFSKALHELLSGYLETGPFTPEAYEEVMAKMEQLRQQDVERIKASEMRDVPRGCRENEWTSLVQAATSLEELRHNRQIKLDQFAERLRKSPESQPLYEAAKEVARLFGAKHRCDTAAEAREAERNYDDALRRQEILIAEQHICALALGLKAKAFTEPSLQLLVERVAEAYPMISRQLIEAVLAAGRGDVGGSSVAEFLLDAFDPSEDFNFVQWQLFCAELFCAAGHFPPPNGQRNSGAS